MTRPQDRVVVVMAKAPRPGQVKTRLSATYPVDRTVELYRCLLLDTLDLTLSLPDTHVAVMAPPGDLTDLVPLLPSGIEAVAQRGTGLAAALHSVFETFTADRPRRVLAFDSDSPHLPVRLLEEAFDALATAHVVVGPTDDGGYYLVGARAPHAGLFDPGPIGTQGALASLLANAEALGLTSAVTSQGFDVDVADDLIRLAALLRDDPARAPRTASCLDGWFVTDAWAPSASPETDVAGPVE